MKPMWDVFKKAIENSGPGNLEGSLKNNEFAATNKVCF
jgi:hypothetical protein